MSFLITVLFTKDGRHKQDVETEQRRPPSDADR